MEESSENNIIKELENIDYMDNVVKTEIITDKILSEVDHVLQLADGDLNSVSISDSDNIFEKIQLDITFGNTNKKRDFIEIMEPNLIENNNMGNFYPENNCMENNCLENIPEKINLNGSNFKENCSENNSILNENSNSIKNIRFNENLNRLTTTNKIVVSVGDEGCLVETNSELINKQLFLTDDSKPKFTSTPLIPHKDREKFFYKDKENSFQKGNFEISGSENLLNKNSLTITPIKRINDTTDSGISSKNTFERSVLKRRSEDGGYVIESKRMALKENVGRFYDQFFKPKKIFKNQSDSDANSGGVLSDSVNTNSDCSRISGSKNIFINPKKIVEHQNKFILKEDLKNNNNEYNSKNLEDILRINANKNILNNSEQIEDRFTNLKQIDYRPEKFENQPDQIENQLKNKNATVENKNPEDNTQVNNESNCDETIYLNETEFYNLQMIIENDLKNSTQQKNDIKITLNDRFKELTKISPRIIKHTPKGIEITVFKDSKIEQSNLIRDEHLNNKELLKNFKRCVTLTNNNNIFISLLISPNEIDKKSVVKSLNEKFKLMPGNQNEMKIFDDNVLKKNKNSNILLCRNFQVIVNNNCKEESLNYIPVEDFKKNSNAFTSRIISYSENNSEKIIQPFLNFDESSEKILLEENSPNKTFGEYSSDKIISTENLNKNCVSNEIQNFDSDEKRNENKKQILETKGSDKLKDTSSDEIYISPEFDTKKMSGFRNVDNHFSSETSSITSEIDDYISLIENRRFHSVTNKNVLSKNESDDDLTSNTTPVDIEEINNININKTSPGFDKTLIPSRDVDKMVNPLGDTSSEISCISDSINLKDYENSLDEFIKDESDSDVEIIPNEIEIISVSDSDMDTEKRVFNYEEYADVTFVDDDDDVNVEPANNKSKKNNLVKIEKDIIDLTLNKNDIIDLTFNEIDVKMDVIDLTLNPNKNNVIDLTIDGDSEFESIIKDLEDVVKSTDDDFVIENEFIKETIVLKEDISSIKDVTITLNENRKIPIVIDKETNGEESDNNAPNDRFVINVSIDSKRTFINQSSIHSHEDLIGDEERYEKEIVIIPEENECRVIQNLKVSQREHPLVAEHQSVSSSENQAISSKEDLEDAQNLGSENIEKNNKILGNKTENLFEGGVVSKFEDITENSSVNNSMEFKNNKSGMENKILLDESLKENVSKILSEELESNEAVIENNIRDQKNSQQSEKEQGISLKNVNNALINTQEDFDEDDGDINKTLIPEERNGNKNRIVDLDKTITPTNIDVKNSFPTDSEKTVIDNSNDYQINFEFKKSDDNSYSKIEKPIFDTNFDDNKIDFEFKKVDIQDSTSKTVLEKPVFDDKNPESRNINFEFKINTEDIPSTSKTVLDDCNISFEFKKVDTNDVPSTSKTVLEKSVLKNTLSNDIPSTSKTVLEKCFSQSIIENKNRILKRRASAEDVERPEIKKQKLQNQCIAVGISKDDTFTDDIADQNFTRLLFNSQKTIDENDPNWIDIKDLATSNEFFTHVCIQWQSDTLPNPQKNLTKRFVDRQPKVVDQPKSCGCFSVIYYLNNRIKYHRQKIYNLEDTLRRCTFGKKKRRSFLDDIQKSMKIIENLEKHKEEVTQINKFYVDNNSGWDAMYLNSIQFNELQEQDATFQMMDRFYK